MRCKMCNKCGRKTGLRKVSVCYMRPLNPIPEKQARLDAMADAETYFCIVSRFIGREPFNRVEAVRFASAAFRAVPGLKAD